MTCKVWFKFLLISSSTWALIPLIKPYINIFYFLYILSGSSSYTSCSQSNTPAHSYLLNIIRLGGKRKSFNMIKTIEFSCSLTSGLNFFNIRCELGTPHPRTASYTIFSKYPPHVFSGKLKVSLTDKNTTNSWQYKDINDIIF